MNNVAVTGRLTSDVDFRTTPGGTNVCTFGIAVQRDYKNSNGGYDADFFTVVAWRNTADFVRQYFGKGKPIEVSGKLQSRSYPDKDGNKRTVVEIVADKIGFTISDSKGKPDASNSGALDPDFAVPAADEDYPF